MKSYYIKERHNPQLQNPSYTACGQLTKKRAQEMEQAIYGTNYMNSFRSEEEYNAEIQRLETEGFTVRPLV